MFKKQINLHSHVKFTKKFVQNYNKIKTKYEQYRKELKEWKKLNKSRIYLYAEMTIYILEYSETINKTAKSNQFYYKSIRNFEKKIDDIYSITKKKGWEKFSHKVIIPITKNDSYWGKIKIDLRDFKGKEVYMKIYTNKIKDMYEYLQIKWTNVQKSNVYQIIQTMTCGFKPISWVIFKNDQCGICLEKKILFGLGCSNSQNHAICKDCLESMVDCDKKNGLVFRNKKLFYNVKLKCPFCRELCNYIPALNYYFTKKL